MPSMRSKNVVGRFATGAIDGISDLPIVAHAMSYCCLSWSYRRCLP